MCIDRPILSLDRPFTYVLPPELGAGVGSLVQVPFHGRLIRGWVLGSSESFGTRTLSVKKVVSPVRFFDEDMLCLLRWVSERYVAPLAAVIGRAVPPRVAGEEAEDGDSADGQGGGGTPATSSPLSSSYRNGDALASALDVGSGAFVVRPAPEDEVAVAVEAVRRCIDGGRRAIVLVPEAVPMPATAAGIVEAFGGRVAMFVGGDKRSRYRTWLDIAGGRFDLVVGTRPAVFAPLGNVGAIVVSRESHPAHREDRAPYYHVRDVALERARLGGAVCVLSAICPSSEASALGIMEVAPSAAAVAAGGGGAGRSGRTRAPTRPRAPRNAPRLHLRAAAGIRDGAGLSRVRSPGGMRGVRRRAPLGRGHGSLHRVRGAGAMRALRGAGFRDQARWRGTRRRVGDDGCFRRGPPHLCARQGSAAESEGDPRGRAGVGA